MQQIVYKNGMMMNNNFHNMLALLFFHTLVALQPQQASELPKKRSSEIQDKSPGSTIFVILLIYIVIQVQKSNENFKQC
ncbi:hypothetical protein BpHYR1_044199 [Brachionus plicatilis]|uniref:Uncharacterized protein n=1 Tax=Brachionus plicatilis TaxID=10195 RepID=A0A3M7PBJ5_BRAPC|nr:hypothetical protein BpHYR1_044199 [Brachionus plicatilis]